MCCSGYSQAVVKKQMFDKDAITVDTVLHQSEISEMGLLRGTCNASYIIIDGTRHDPGCIRFIRFCSNKFDATFHAYTGIAEFRAVLADETIASQRRDFKLLRNATVDSSSINNYFMATAKRKFDDDFQSPDGTVDYSAKRKDHYLEGYSGSRRTY